MENVESMLCAYVEGDLDEAGRAEIEKHLLEHPQHRKLLEDLMASRRLLKELPRVKASGEVDDSLKGVTERSILLDDSRHAVASSESHGSRLGRWMALAAIVLLCLALGMIVYKTVGPTNKPPNTAITQVTPLPPAPVESTPADAANTPVVATAQPPEATVTEKVESNAAPMAAAASPQAAASPEQSDGQLKKQQGSPNLETSAVVMVVHSADPVGAAGRLADWLRGQNDLKWTFVPALGGANNGLQNSTYSANGANNGLAIPSLRLDEMKNAATEPSTAPSDQTQLADAARERAGSAPPVPPSAIAGRDEYWVHGVTAAQLDAIAASLKDQFNAPVDKYSASIAMGPVTNTADIANLAQANSQSVDAGKDLPATQPATDSGALAGAAAPGGMSGGGGGFGGGGGGRHEALILDARRSGIFDRAPATSTLPDQPAMLDAIIVIAPLAAGDVGVESPATMPSTQPTNNIAAPTTLPGS